MFRRTPRAASALALVLTTAAAGLVAAPAAHAAAPAPCGTSVSDFTGATSKDTPFVGKIVIPDSGFEDREITLSPVTANSSLLKVEIKVSDNQTTSVTGNFTLRVNQLNHGQLTFPLYTDGIGRVTDVACGSGLLPSSRVTTIAGTVTTTGVNDAQGIPKRLDFTASRT
ncbi:hypothetical protein [Streptomyces lavendulae]|uniref:hypothetical protein n=1 Tax=Streptomyces lavendulae TaxID=1914 RepID=UPI0024A45D39|nr:hypothetical protein [Streptomyces lavendulae]GLX19265.1 hypothetical protein Slala01_29090 [Streptomyces lavendulae subsp. lavendulae]GLX25984.1 hypothetical protein Slala02_18040 [Streptomyces lavendulae subsp. lavendulae]